MNTKAKTFLGWLATLLVGSNLVASFGAPALNSLTDAERKAGWKLLFDGQTTTGWRGYKMEKMPPGWAVIDGVLTRVKGGAGGDDIVTTEEFENFDLQLEWKTVPSGNSGVLYHVSEEPVTACIMRRKCRFSTTPRTRLSASWNSQIFGAAPGTCVPNTPIAPSAR